MIILKFNCITRLNSTSFSLVEHASWRSQTTLSSCSERTYGHFIIGFTVADSKMEKKEQNLTEEFEI